MTPWLWLPLLVIALVALDRLLLAAERRRWIYYRTTSAPKGAAADEDPGPSDD